MGVGEGNEPPDGKRDGEAFLLSFLGEKIELVDEKSVTSNGHVIAVERDFDNLGPAFVDVAY